MSTAGSQEDPSLGGIRGGELLSSASAASSRTPAGADVVARAAGIEDATISAVNYAETLQNAARAGVAIEDVDVALEALGITVSPFGRLDARLTASFYRHQSQLSLADRVCLALARSLSRRGVHRRLRAKRQVSRVGPVGIEPTTRGLKVRCSAD